MCQTSDWWIIVSGSVVLFRECLVRYHAQDKHARAISKGSRGQTLSSENEVVLTET